jgi:hypothetical protein
MNDSAFPSDPLLDPLFARARAERRDTSRAEYAFETRLLANLPRPAEKRTGMGALAWRLLPYLALVVLGLGIIQFETGRDSQDAERAASLQNPETVDLFSTFQ